MRTCCFSPICLESFLSSPVKKKTKKIANKFVLSSGWFLGKLEREKKTQIDNLVRHGHVKEERDLLMPFHAIWKEKADSKSTCNKQPSRIIFLNGVAWIGASKIDCKTPAEAQKSLSLIVCHGLCIRAISRRRSKIKLDLAPPHTAEG